MYLILFVLFCFVFVQIYFILFHFCFVLLCFAWFSYFCFKVIIFDFIFVFFMWSYLYDGFTWSSSMPLCHFIFSILCLLLLWWVRYQTSPLYHHVGWCSLCNGVAAASCPSLAHRMLGNSSQHHFRTQGAGSCGWHLGSVTHPGIISGSGLGRFCGWRQVQHHQMWHHLRWGNGLPLLRAVCLVCGSGGRRQ